MKLPYIDRWARARVARENERRRRRHDADTRLHGEPGDFAVGVELRVSEDSSLAAERLVEDLMATLEARGDIDGYVVQTLSRLRVAELLHRIDPDRP